MGDRPEDLPYVTWEQYVAQGAHVTDDGYLAIGPYPSPAATGVGFHSPAATAGQRRARLLNEAARLIHALAMLPIGVGKERDEVRILGAMAVDVTSRLRSQAYTDRMLPDPRSYPAELEETRSVWRRAVDIGLRSAAMGRVIDRLTEAAADAEGRR